MHKNNLTYNIVKIIVPDNSNDMKESVW